MLAGLAFWTETTEVKWTQFLLLVVFERAVRAQRAEASVVVRAGWSLGFGVDVEVETVVAVRAHLGARIVLALGHAAKVVFV